MFDRCPTKKLKEVVPIEKWTGRKQSVIYFKVFGSVCYKHIPNATRRKLDDRSRVMLLIGHHCTCEYKLYFQVTNKDEGIKDIIVKESKTWDWSKSQSNSSTVSTLEFGCASEGDFASKGDSDSEGESKSENYSALKVTLIVKVSLNLKNNYGSKGDFDSEGESDSEGDSNSDGGLDYEGDPTFEVNFASKGSITPEGGTSKGGPTSKGELAQF